MKLFALCIPAAIALLGAVAPPSSAQVVTGLAPGARVRLLTPRLEASQQTVTVISSSPDSVHVRPVGYDFTRSIPLSEITAVEIRSFGERPFLRNMMVGAALGGGLGGILAYATHEECDNCWYPSSPARDAAGGALLGGLTGVLGGLLVASAQRGERWTRIVLNPNVALLPALDGRFHLNLTRTF